MSLVSSLIIGCFLWSSMSNNYLSTIGQVGQPISWIHLAHWHRTVVKPILHYPASCHKKRVAIWLVSYLKMREEKSGRLQLLGKCQKVEEPSKRQEAPPHPLLPPSVDCHFPPFNNNALRIKNLPVDILLYIRLVLTMRTEFTSLLLHEIEHYYIC